MANNPAKTINYYGQLFLLALATFSSILAFTPLMVFSMFLMYLLPILGVWQTIDFAMLWTQNGHKKWYILYICAMVLFALLLLIGYIFSDDSDIVNFRSIIGFACYNIIVAWIYLLYWRKQ